jgi:hypothetical protein
MAGENPNWSTAQREEYRARRELNEALDKIALLAPRLPGSAPVNVRVEAVRVLVSALFPKGYE